MAAKGDKLSCMSLSRHWIYWNLDFEFIMLNAMPLSKNNIRIHGRTVTISNMSNLKFVFIIKAGELEMSIMDHHMCSSYQL